MIGNFEGNNPDLNITFCEVNKMILSALRSIFFINPSFTFIDITNKSEWLAGIQSKDIIVLRYIEDVTSISEDHVFQITPQQIHISEFVGKYGYELLFNYSESFYADLINYDQQDYDVIFGDVEGNMWLRSNFKGFTTELISFDKQNFTNKATQLNLWFWDPEEFKSIYKFKPSFNYRSLRQVPITLDNITEISANTYQFTTSVTTLSINDLTISDNIVITSITSFSHLGNGVYRITTGQALNYGSIDVQNDYYYGSGDYVFVALGVTISNFSYLGSNVYELTVKETVTSANVNTLVLGDISVSEAININAQSFIGAGVYQITTASELSTGTISVSNDNYTGNAAYDFNVQQAVNITVGAWSLDTDYILYFKVDINGTGIAGLTGSDITFTEATPDSITDVGSGVYYASFSTEITGGDINVNNADYLGSASYGATETFGYYKNNNEVVVGGIPAKMSTSGNISLSVANGEITTQNDGLIRLLTTGITEGNTHRLSIEVVSISDNLNIAEDINYPIDQISTPGTKTIDFISLYSVLFLDFEGLGNAVIGDVSLVDNGAATAIQLQVIAFSGRYLYVKVSDLSNIGITGLDQGNFRMRLNEGGPNGYLPPDQVVELSDINDIGIYRLLYFGGITGDSLEWLITCMENTEGYISQVYDPNFIKWFSDFNFRKEIISGVTVPVGIESTFLPFAGSLSMTSTLISRNWSISNDNSAYNLDLKLSTGFDDYAANNGTLRITLTISTFSAGALDLTLDSTSGTPLQTWTTAGAKSYDIAYTTGDSAYLILRKTDASTAACVITALQLEFIP